MALSPYIFDASTENFPRLVRLVDEFDRGLRQDAGHTGLLAILHMLPEDGERAQRYRAWLHATSH